MPMTTKELRAYIDRVLGNNVRLLLPSYWWKRLFGATIDVVDDVSKSVVKMNKDINEKLENMSSYEEITYAELYKKQYNAKLIPNRLYRITDYRCSLGPQVKNAVVADYDQFKNFNIIVKALTESRLDENARATDVVGTSTGYNKASWEIKYSIGNDVKKFPWASYGDLEVDISVAYETGYGTKYRNFIWVEEKKCYEANRHIYINTNVDYGMLVTSLNSNDILGKTAFNKGDKVYVLENGITYEATVLYTKEMKDTGEGVLIGGFGYDAGINTYEAYVWDSAENAYIGIKQGRKLCGEDHKILEKQNSFEPCMPVSEYYISDSGVHTYIPGKFTMGFNIPHGTGVIYYMKDDNNNVAFYDFKQIKFLIPGENTPRFTFEYYYEEGSSSNYFANNYIENCGGLNGVSLYSKYSDIEFKNNYIASTVTDVCFKQPLSNKHIGTDNEGNTQIINIFDTDAKTSIKSVDVYYTTMVNEHITEEQMLANNKAYSALYDDSPERGDAVIVKAHKVHNGQIVANWIATSNGRYYDGTGARYVMITVREVFEEGDAYTGKASRTYAEKVRLSDDGYPKFIEEDLIDSEMSSTSDNPVQNKVVTAALNNKVDKVDGKQLSTEDFTTALKTKLEGLSNYDDTSIQNAVNNLTTQINTLVSGDASVAIESFNEIISFLNGIEDSDSLDSIIASIEQQISNKQNKIEDIETIRSGAALGATALQEHQDISHLATKEEVENLENEVITDEEIYAAAVTDLNSRLININESISTEITTREVLSEEFQTFKTSVTENEEVWAKSLTDINDRITANYNYGETTYSTKTELQTEIEVINTVIVENEEVIAATLTDLNSQIASLNAIIAELTTRIETLENA